MLRLITSAQERSQSLDAIQSVSINYFDTQYRREPKRIGTATRRVFILDFVLIGLRS